MPPFVSLGRVSGAFAVGQEVPTGERGPLGYGEGIGKIGVLSTARASFWYIRRPDESLGKLLCAICVVSRTD